MLACFIFAGPQRFTCTTNCGMSFVLLRWFSYKISAFIYVIHGYRTCSSLYSFRILPGDVFFSINRGLTRMSLSDQEISSLVFEEINRAEHLSDLSLPWRNSTTARETICKDFVLFGLEKNKGSFV